MGATVVFGTKCAALQGAARPLGHSYPALLREFTDKNGTHWRVWDINPVLHARPAKPGKRPSARVPKGWLCFEGGNERRRLIPIPEEWQECDDATLESLCLSAEVVPRLILDVDAGDH